MPNSRRAVGISAGGSREKADRIKRAEGSGARKEQQAEKGIAFERTKGIPRAGVCLRLEQKCQFLPRRHNNVDVQRQRCAGASADAGANRRGPLFGEQVYARRTAGACGFPGTALRAGLAGGPGVSEAGAHVLEENEARTADATGVSRGSAGQGPQRESI